MQSSVMDAITKDRAANRDPRAARILRGLREDLGLSPELMPAAMEAAGIDAHKIPSARALRRYEDPDVAQIPVVAYRAGLAEFHGRSIASIWRPTTRRAVA